MRSSRTHTFSRIILPALCACSILSLAAQTAHKADPKASASDVTPQEAPPKPASILLKDGALTVAADNSDLGQILSQICATTGMTIDGSVNAARVFGTYGPQSTRQVLTALLDGTGSNFMIVGHTDHGTPRQLLLTPRESASAPSGTSSQGGVNPASPDPSTSSAPSTPSTTSTTSTTSDAPAASPSAAPNAEQVGPGAIVDVPPAPPDDAQQRAQQHLQQLQTQQEQLKQPSGQPQ